MKSRPRPHRISELICGVCAACGCGAQARAFSELVIPMPERLMSDEMGMPHFQGHHPQPQQTSGMRRP